MMQSYGAYIVSAFSLMFFVMGINIFSIIQERNQVKKRIKRHRLQHES